MFPPKPTEIAEEWVSGLWESLQRAGDDFLDTAYVEPLDDKTVEVVLYAKNPISTASQPYISNYAMEYGRACGWLVKHVRFRPGYVAFEASKVLSRACANK